MRLVERRHRPSQGQQQQPLVTAQLTGSQAPPQWTVFTLPLYDRYTTSAERPGDAQLGVTARRNRRSLLFRCMRSAAMVVTHVDGVQREAPLLVLPVGDALQEPFWPEGVCMREHAVHTSRGTSISPDGAFSAHLPHTCHTHCTGALHWSTGSLHWSTARTQHITATPSAFARPLFFKYI